MNPKTIYLCLAIVCCLGCVNPNPGQGSAVSPGATPYSKMELAAKTGVTDSLVLDPYEMEKLMLPEMSDLPAPANLRNKYPPRKYIGIIKNTTAQEVSVPSSSSGATLIIPPRGWIEYVSYARRFNVTAYHDGKPFYCMKINAKPRTYAFMCDKYDFLAEIVKPEPVKKSQPLKKKRRLKKKPKSEEGVQGLG